MFPIPIVPIPIDIFIECERMIISQAAGSALHPSFFHANTDICWVAIIISLDLKFFEIVRRSTVARATGSLLLLCFSFQVLDLRRFLTDYCARWLAGRRSPTGQVCTQCDSAAMPPHPVTRPAARSSRIAIPALCRATQQLASNRFLDTVGSRLIWCLASAVYGRVLRKPLVPPPGRRRRSRYRESEWQRMSLQAQSSRRPQQTMTLTEGDKKPPESAKHFNRCCLFLFFRCLRINFVRK